MDQSVQKSSTSCQLLQNKFWWQKCYQNRKIHDYQEGVQEFEQAPIAPAPKPKLAVETVEIKKEIVKSDNFDKTKGSAKKLMDVRPAKRAEKKESFQRQLSENTAKMNIIKKPRIE